MRKAAAVLFIALLAALWLPSRGGGEENEAAFRERLAAFRSWAAGKWAELGRFSESKGLYLFAEEDYARARRLGAKVKRYVPPDLPPPEGAKALYEEWGRRRRAFLKELEERAAALLEWCGREYPAGKAEAARAVLGELPDFAAAHLALGETYSEELGWVSGERAEKVRKGLLPFGRSWLPREEVLALRSDWNSCWTVEGKYFTVRTNTSPKLARRLLRFLDTYRSWWRSYFRGFGPNKVKGRMSVNLFATREDYLRCTRLIFPASSLYGAFYFDRTGCTYILAGSGPGGELFSPTLVAHEHSHQFVHQFFNAPCRRYYYKPGAWINEGIASYCESLIVTADRTAFAGYRSLYHFRGAQAHLAAGRLVPLAKYVETEGDDFTRGKERGVLYNEGMALVAFFLHSDGGKRRKGFYRYVREVLSGNGSRGLFRLCFGKEPAELEPEFHAWLRGGGEKR